MNEAETRAEHIDPALKAAGWGVVEGSKILREYWKAIISILYGSI
jgi:type I restriction enzyme, R subunit